MSFPLAVALALALGFLRTGLAQDERCVDLMKDSSCQSDGPRFFYNSTRSRCQRLVGGCGSNNNTFKTLESCQTLCYGNGRPLSEDPGNSDFNILFGIIVLMVVFMIPTVGFWSVSGRSRCLWRETPSDVFVSESIKLYSVFWVKIWTIYYSMLIFDICLLG
ncbi:uncharacterized protein LOC120571428 isoform X1 [Perca fluviatilis]|uniref:uncharacterized protein LOC120571428 isoform X1 n=1 Tax=Perca fluviatilis TaxID=8168 RepID=UPI0019630869|nr:uncharacterized protein LOC120571428 isoform X1 [Perca fluviatilis]